MDMISGLLAQTQPKPQSPYDTITRLCDRLQHSSMLEDRRAAVLGLKGFSRDYREAVAAGGLRSLIQALHRDAEDVESCRATLETLIILFIQPNEQDDSQRTRNKEYRSPLDQGSQTDLSTRDYISLWLTDEFTQKEDNVVAILELLRSTSDFYIKLYSLQLLSAIIAGRPKRAQDCIFTAPFGISTVVSILDDSREAIRNEAILVLLNLVADHSDVQKLVVFEGAFEKLFYIISDEGGLSGGVVVEDCLLLMSSLLRYNMSNQNMFRETSCVPKLAKILQLEPEGDPGDADYLPLVWDDQLGSNLRHVLELCRLFVIQGHWATPVNQLALCKAGILMNVMRIVFGGVAPVSIRTAGLLTIADLIRANDEIQHDFLSIDVPYVDLSVALQIQRQPDIIPVSFALLNWALLCNSVHTFDLRSAAHLCLNAAMQDNIMAKKTFLEEQVAHYKGVALSKESDITEKHENNENHENHENGSIEHPTSENLNKQENENSEKQDDSTETENDDNKLFFDPAVLPSDTANLISALADYDPDARLNPYKTWFAAVILLYVFDDTEDNYQQALEVRETVQNVIIGDESIGEETVTFVQAVCGMLVTSLQYTDSRISIAYLMLLTVWLYDDLKVVNNFLSESTVVQSLISLITTHAGGTTKNNLIEPMAAVLLGVAYDFTAKDSPISRQELHKLLTGTVGRDQYVLKVKKLKEMAIFREFDDEHHWEEIERDETGLPNVFLCGVYVNFVRTYFSRIQKALDRDPLSEPNSRISLEMYDSLQQQYAQTAKLLDELKAEYAESASTNTKKVEYLEKILEETRAEKEKHELQLKLNDSEIEKSSAELMRVSSALSSLQEEHSKLTAANDQNSISLTESGKESESLKAKTKSLQSQLQSMTDQKEKAENGINKMNRELMILSKSKAETERQNSDLHKKLAELEKKINKLVDVERRLKDDFSVLLKTKNDYEEQIKDLSKTQGMFDKLKTDHVNLSREFELTREDLDESEKLKGTLIEKLKSAGSQIVNHKENSKRLEIQVQELNERCQELERANDALKRNESDVAANSEELKKLQNEIQQAKQETENWKIKAEKLGARETELTAELDKTRESHLAELSKTKQDHSLQLETLRKEHQIALDEIKEGKAKEFDASQEKSLNELKKTHQKEINDMKKTHEQNIKNLGEKLNAAEKEIASHATKLSDQVSAHERILKEREAATEDKIAELEKDYEQKLNEARKDGDQSLTSELAEMKDRFTQQIKDSLDRAKTHKTELLEKDGVIDSLKEDLKKHNSMFAERLKELEENKKKELEQLSLSHRSELEERDIQSEQLRKELAILKEDSEKQKIFIEELQEVGNSHTELKKKVEDSDSKIKSIEEKHAIAEKVLEEKNTKLQDIEKKLTISQELYEALSKRMQDVQKENEKLQKELEQTADSASRQQSQDTVPRSELDDLMLVMADLEESKIKYKKRLVELHETVSSDEDDSDDDSDDD